MGSDEKLAVLVLEGISNHLLDSWCLKGFLPNLSALRSKQGGFLESLTVPYEASALQTAFTGYSPGEHGVFSYWKIHNPDYVPQIWGSNELYKPYIWQREEFQDKKFAVINIFGTHPPYSINGSMITYLFKQSLHACYPKNLLKGLANEGYGYGQDVSMFYSGQPREEFLRGLLQVESCRVRIAEKMMADSDILIANLTIADRASHFYWQEIEDGSPIALEDSALLKSYQVLDKAVGEFVELLGGNSNLFIFSDIGFGSLREFVSINELLRQGGFLTRTAENQVDWNKSKAFETVQGSHGVDIHLKGRYSSGTVEKGDFKKICSEVAEYLKGLINPKTGFLYFSDVIPSGELYPGEHCNEAPDLIVRPADERYLPLGDDYWARRVHREYQSGWHRRECFWTGSGPAFQGVKGNGAIADIAPTIFRLSGRAIPGEFRGRSLLG
ncbi:MAG TPA: alkaline phosphatase family protein [Ruminiclostridium sp.]|nr:alkaline phosphatase family protein [Ruminiclostridium sp.]